ncbi:MAG: spondin domain-containing protein [Planctomycetes bacterium]|nr:spondin domain-containing protein [Planctomycetota bacterium]MBI3843746.1 spondin domain-containing protein [Planctomycetota bacterium]
MLRTSHLLGFTMAACCSAAALAADEVVTFKVTVTNVSTPMTLKLSNEQTAPAPTSPVFYCVHTDHCPAFTTGKVDTGKGLENLAEDGDPSMLVKNLTGMPGVEHLGVANTPVGDSKPGPALPGKSFEFTVTGGKSCHLMIAMMFGQSNDLFLSPKEHGISLFDTSGKPISGDVTSQFYLWDAGTEVNEEPGLGPNQGPRQKAANTGPTEKEPVQLVADRHDGFTYPLVKDVIKVTISPMK